MLSILFGLGSALAWGAADFTGGLASRRARSYQVVIVAEIVGLFPLLALAILSKEPPPPPSAWLWSAAASSLGSFGLLILYRALAEGQMTIAAPVSALLAAVVPVLVGALTLGLPGPFTLLGFGLALISIWTISQTNTATDGCLLPGGLRNPRALYLPLLSGIFFGSYFVLMHEATVEAFFWPLLNGRVAGTLVMLLYAGAVRGSVWPRRQVWPAALVSGAADVLGSICYVLAAQGGRLDVAAVLAALYPGSTVILARLFLKEKITRFQVIGIVLALAAIVLMTF